MKTTILILAALLTGFAAFANPELETVAQNAEQKLSLGVNREHPSMLNPLTTARRGSGTIWRFGVQVMPMLQLVGEGKNTDLDKTGKLTYKKLTPTVGAGFVLKLEPSPYFQIETGINYVRKSYKFEQKSFTTPGVTGNYTLNLSASQDHCLRTGPH